MLFLLYSIRVFTLVRFYKELGILGSKGVIKSTSSTYRATNHFILATTKV